MKRIKSLFISLAGILAISIYTSSVYAGGVFPIYTELQNTGTISDYPDLFKWVCLYEGDIIKSDVIVNEYYGTSLTDFEIAVENDSSNIVSIISSFEEAVLNKDKTKLYYLQIVDMASKVVIPGGTNLATIELKIPDNIFNYDQIQQTAGNAREMSISASCKTNHNTGDQHSYSLDKSIYVIPYKIGDINRDYEIDFYDIVEEIAIVYDTAQT